MIEAFLIEEAFNGPLEVEQENTAGGRDLASSTLAQMVPTAPDLQRAQPWDWH